MAKHYQTETPIKLNGTRVPAGKTVPLDDDRAGELLAIGAVTPAAAPAAADGKKPPAAKAGAKSSSPAGR